MAQREIPDQPPHPAETVPAIRGQVFTDARKTEEIPFVREDFLRCSPAEKIAKQTRDGLDNQRVRFGLKKTVPGLPSRHEPQSRQTTGHQTCVGSQFWGEQRARPRPVD